MSFTVRLRDKTVHNLDHQNGESLKKTLMEANGTILVELGGSMVRSSEIVSIKRNRDPILDSHQVGAGNRCRGQYSIQKEINDIARDEGGSKWAKLIQNKKWREETRKRLRNVSPDVQWCDYRAKECACG